MTPSGSGMQPETVVAEQGDIVEWSWPDAAGVFSRVSFALSLTAIALFCSGLFFPFFVFSSHASAGFAAGPASGANRGRPIQTCRGRRNPDAGGISPARLLRSRPVLLPLARRLAPWPRGRHQRQCLLFLCLPLCFFFANEAGYSQSSDGARTLCP